MTCPTPRIWINRLWNSFATALFSDADRQGSLIPKIAIFGGTFDPIHRGHLHAAEVILEQGLVSKIFMIPAGNPWQKEGQLVATSGQRLEMCRLATSGNPKIEVLDIEINRSGPTYSIETVLELEKNFPAFEFSLVLGTDALKNIMTWHRVDELIKKIEVLQLLRSGEKINSADIPVGIDIKIVEGSMLDISSTLIREKVAKNADVSE
ncbi:MAG: nicotinate (nicotinamide) nucleotide adenylyltransferase [Actinobacteria bacterium]|nr:nicotinate (nicotinamide) nucleotide adenylyltransferase [Actinomycetota bacterium]